MDPCTVMFRSLPSVGQDVLYAIHSCHRSVHGAFVRDGRVVWIAGPG